MTTTMTVRPIRDGLTFGARIGGVTQDGLGDARLRAEINEAFEKYGLLIFEDVEPSPKLQVELSKVIGPLKDHPSKAVPPRTSARSGAAMLPPLSTARIASGPTSTIAPKPSTKVSR